MCTLAEKMENELKNLRKKIKPRQKIEKEQKKISMEWMYDDNFPFVHLDI